MHGAILYEADLEDASLLGADLSHADLSGCRAKRASFGQAKLNHASLFHATLERATFSHADLSHTDCRTANLKRARMREANLQEAHFERADLQRADLEHSTVRGANFHEANLHRALVRGLKDYCKAHWIGARITGIDFCGAWRLRRFILDQNYLYEFRNESRTAGVVYWIWWATSDCGRSFVRWSLWTLLIMVMYGGLYDWVELSYAHPQTPLSNLYYSAVTLTTLGYGDILPVTPAAQLTAMSEVILGYLMLGGLLSIFANKMARRAS